MVICQNPDRCDLRSPSMLGGTCNSLGDPPDRPMFGLTFEVQGDAPPSAPEATVTVGAGGEIVVRNGGILKVGSMGGE